MARVAEEISIGGVGNRWKPRGMPEQALWVVRAHDAGEGLDVVHGVAAQVRQPNA